MKIRRYKFANTLAYTQKRLSHTVHVTAIIIEIVFKWQ